MKELGKVALGWRYAGIAIVAVGILLLVALRFEQFGGSEAVRIAGFALLILGAGLMIVAIVLRTSYHHKRMKQITGG
jgi:tellurite resistance protein TehA-like permease